MTPGGSFRRWFVATAVLTCGYLYIGGTSPLPWLRWPTLAGALLVLAALWLVTRPRRGAGPMALGMLVCGALVPAVIEWWSLVVPVTALLILGCGALAVRAATAGRLLTPAPARPGPGPGPGGPMDGEDQ